MTPTGNRAKSPRILAALSATIGRMPLVRRFDHTKQQLCRQGDGATVRDVDVRRLATGERADLARSLPPWRRISGRRRRCVRGSYDNLGARDLVTVISARRAR
jgi:hypothetical protein